MRTLIGLLVAVAIIITLGVLVHNYLDDYLIDTGNWPPSLDWERFLSDMANKFVDHLYDTAPSSQQTVSEALAPSES